MDILHLEESSHVQCSSSWITYHVQLTTFKNPKPTHSRKMHQHQTYMFNLPCGIRFFMWSPIKCNTKGIRFFLNWTQRQEIPSHEMINALFSFMWMNHFSTKGYFIHYQRTFFLTSHLSHPSCILLCLICEAMAHAQPGPIDDSLLHLQHNHISNKV